MQNMLRNTLWTWGTHWEPIRNLEGTPWEHIGKQGKMEKKSFPPPKLKRNKSKAPWAFPLAERKINPPPCAQIKLAWKVHSPLSTPNTAWKKKLPLQPPTTPTRAESCNVRLSVEGWCDGPDGWRTDGWPDGFRGSFI